MPIAEDARALAEAMIASGREPLWCVLVVGWYFGDRGREAVLELLEERAGNTPRPSGVEPF
jgi:hypothetical protein